MKSFNRLVLLSLALASTSALAADRLVVSVKDATPTAGKIISLDLSVPEHCFMLDTGAPWCVPVLADSSSGNAMKAASTSAVETYTSATLTVPDGLSPQQAKALLIQSGLYTHVEHDVAVQTFNGDWSTLTPNDPRFSSQLHFDDNTAANPMASSVLSFWRKINAPTTPTDVYVMDAGFRLHTDLNYAPGVNFTVVAFDNERKPGFIESDFKASCDSAHGTGVAGVIGASINNGEGIAGIVGDVTIHPIRVLDCRNGFLSDVSAALDWMTGGSTWLRQQSPELPEFTGRPGVINLSLGGQSTNCPIYLQNAINKAVSKGFTLVVAAGNESTDTAGVSPANCNNVITVAAASKLGTMPIDLASFSNYGKNIDIIAQGEGVQSLTSNNKYSSWNGTSFSSPIVTGIIAAASKDFAFTPPEWEILMSISGEKVFSDTSRCASLGCGSGLLNANKLYANAQKLEKGELNSASFTLNAVSACRQDWAIKFLSEGQRLCDQVTINLSLYENLTSDEFVTLYTAPIGTTASSQDISSLTWRGEYDSAHFIIDKSEIADKDVFGQRCDRESGICSSLTKVNTSAMASVPEVCKE